jgi:hypothetical protein
LEKRVKKLEKKLLEENEEKLRKRDMKHAEKRN